MLDSLYIERTTAPFERCGRMFPVECLQETDEDGFPKALGYRSVYMFCKEDAECIRNRKESKGFAEFSVFSDCLFIDIDIKSPEEDATALAQIEALKEMDVHFELYTSGNRSYHLHIPHPLKRGFSLPHTHFKVAEALGITCDSSLYRANSLFRLNGTFHKKTGLRKELVGVYGSKKLDFPLLDEERFTTIRPKRRLTNGEERHLAVITIFRNICDYLGEYGIEKENRFLAMNRLIYPLAPFISFETALEIGVLINQGIDNPNEIDEVVRAIQGCYK